MHQSSQQRKFITSCTHLTHRSYLYRQIHVHVQYGRFSLHLLPDIFIYFLCLKGHTRFLNFYGQPEARLNRDQSVHGTRTNQRTWFIKTISIFLFSAPDVHLRILQKMWVDGIMHRAVWEASLNKVNEEWREFTLYVSRDIPAPTCLSSSPGYVLGHCAAECECGFSWNATRWNPICRRNFKLFFH
jgi:hypothetical protein